MGKHIHEIRDPIHVFIRLESLRARRSELEAGSKAAAHSSVSSHSLAVPGATHRRFEHSLGVMELAGRVYDIVTDPDNIQAAAVRDIVPQNTRDHAYWRCVVRMAALCHDIGHLPFSHAAERELLPSGWNHERLSKELILDSELAPKWKALHLNPEDVAKIAVGPKHFVGQPFTDWESILSEIITGNAFGVDRMDYLLRDSLHAGVAYGRFDHYRLIDTLRILPCRVTDPDDNQDPAREAPSSTQDGAQNREFAGAAAKEAGDASSDRVVPMLGIEEGGLHSAEPLLLARYFMYTQLYFHPVRRIYDVHLKAFLKQWLREGCFSTSLADHLNLTDNEVMAAVLDAARNESHPGHDPAGRIAHREHFRTLYQRNPTDVALNPGAAMAIYEAATCRFPPDNVHLDRYKERNRALDFPVLMRDDRVVSCLELSDTLKNVPIVAVECVYIAPHLRLEAEAWLQSSRAAIIAPEPEDQR